MEASLEFEMGWTDVEVEPLGGGLYRLGCASTYLGEPILQHGDVFEAIEQRPGTLRFVRLVRKSDWHNYFRLLHPSVFRTKAFAEFADQVRAASGKMEIAFGGGFHLSLPPRTRFDPIKAARAAYRRHGAARAEISPLEGWQWSDGAPSDEPT